MAWKREGLKEGGVTMRMDAEEPGCGARLAPFGPEGILEICPSALRKVGARGFLPIKETQGCHLYPRQAFLTSRAPT